MSLDVVTPELEIGMAVRFVGGKYNGYQGQITMLSDSFACVTVMHESKPVELVEDTRFLVCLKTWTTGKSKVELNLRGGSR